MVNAAVVNACIKDGRATFFFKDARDKVHRGQLTSIPISCLQRHARPEWVTRWFENNAAPAPRPQWVTRGGWRTTMQTNSKPTSPAAACRPRRRRFRCRRPQTTLPSPVANALPNPEAAYSTSCRSFPGPCSAFHGARILDWRVLDFLPMSSGAEVGPVREVLVRASRHCNPQLARGLAAM